MSHSLFTSRELAYMELNEYIEKRASERGGSVYMPYLTLGDPNYESSVEFAVAMIDAGADILELGIPFSDPTADGPVVQAAMTRALERNDFSMRTVFDVARRIHEARPDVPLTFLSYMNPILNGVSLPDGRNAGTLDLSQSNPAGRLQYDARLGMEAFLKECRSAGIRGLVIPDLPFDQPESAILRELGPEYGVVQVLMVAPNTGDARLTAICEAARGFIYYVTSLGVTGMRADLPEDLKDRIRLVKERSGLPVLAGFGFSEPSQAEQLSGIVDGIIVGSLNQRIIGEHGENSREPLAEVTRGFAAACGARV